VEAQAHGVRLSVGEAVVVVQSEQPQPGVEIGGQVAGEHLPDVDLPELRGQVGQAHRLVRAHLVFHFGVIPVQDVEELDLTGAGAPHMCRMFVAVIE
jgi:hypothetical protein